MHQAENTHIECGFKSQQLFYHMTTVVELAISNSFNNYLSPFVHSHNVFKFYAKNLNMFFCTYANLMSMLSMKLCLVFLHYKLNLFKPVQKLYIIPCC